MIRILKKHEVIVLFCILFFIYNLNGQFPLHGDTIPASILPFIVLENHELYFDLLCQYYYSYAGLTYYFFTSGSHVFSVYPIVTPVVLMPIYAIPYMLLKVFGVPIDLTNPAFSLAVLYMEKISATAITALSGIFIYLSVKKLVNGKVGLLALIVYALGTETWAISSQALWQHGLEELLIAASIYLVIRDVERQRSYTAPMLGVFSGLLLFNRLPSSVLLIPVVYYILSCRGRRFFSYVAGALVSALPFLLYNLVNFGSLFGGYSTQTSMFDMSVFPEGLSGLLISPGRGILIYTPVVCFAILGLLKVKKLDNTRLRNFLILGFISSLGLLLIYSFFSVWWGGWCYGPRYLTDAMPFIALLIAAAFLDNPGLSFDKKNRPFMVVFTLLLCISILVQAIGAFYYPATDWDAYASKDIHKRLWDPGDTQIMRSIADGPVMPRNILNDINTAIAFRHVLGSVYGIYGILYENGLPSVIMSDNLTINEYTSRDNASMSFDIAGIYCGGWLDVYDNGQLVLQKNITSTSGYEHILVPLSRGNNAVVLKSREDSYQPSDIEGLGLADTWYMSFKVRNIKIS